MSAVGLLFQRQCRAVDRSSGADSGKSGAGLLQKLQKEVCSSPLFHAENYSGSGFEEIKKGRAHTFFKVCLSLSQSGIQLLSSSVLRSRSRLWDACKWGRSRALFRRCRRDRSCGIPSGFRRYGPRLHRIRCWR